MILFTIHWLIPKTDWERGIKPSISFLLRLHVYRIWVWSRYKEISLIDKHESNHSSFWAFFNISSSSWSIITHILYFQHSELSASLFSLHSCNCISSIHFAHCGSWKPFTLQSSKSATCCLWMYLQKEHLDLWIFEGSQLKPMMQQPLSYLFQLFFDDEAPSYDHWILIGGI